MPLRLRPWPSKPNSVDFAFHHRTLSYPRRLSSRAAPLRLSAHSFSTFTSTLPILRIQTFSTLPFRPSQSDAPFRYFNPLSNKFGSQSTWRPAHHRFWCEAMINPYRVDLDRPDVRGERFSPADIKRRDEEFEAIIDDLRAKNTAPPVEGCVVIEWDVSVMVDSNEEPFVLLLFNGQHRMLAARLIKDAMEAEHSFDFRIWILPFRQTLLEHRAALDETTTTSNQKDQIHLPEADLHFAKAFADVDADGVLLPINWPYYKRIIRVLGPLDIVTIKLKLLMRMGCQPTLREQFSRAVRMAFGFGALTRNTNAKKVAGDVNWMSMGLFYARYLDSQAPLWGGLEEQFSRAGSKEMVETKLLESFLQRYEIKLKFVRGVLVWDCPTPDALAKAWATAIRLSGLKDANKASVSLLCGEAFFKHLMTTKNIAWFAHETLPGQYRFKARVFASLSLTTTTYFFQQIPSPMEGVVRFFDNHAHLAINLVLRPMLDALFSNASSWNRQGGDNVTGGIDALAVKYAVEFPAMLAVDFLREGTEAERLVNAHKITDLLLPFPVQCRTQTQYWMFDLIAIKGKIGKPLFASSEDIPKWWLDKPMCDYVRPIAELISPAGATLLWARLAKLPDIRPYPKQPPGPQAFEDAIANKGTMKIELDPDGNVKDPSVARVRKALSERMSPKDPFRGSVRPLSGFWDELALMLVIRRGGPLDSPLTPDQVRRIVTASDALKETDAIYSVNGFGLINGKSSKKGDAAKNGPPAPPDIPEALAESFRYDVLNYVASEMELEKDDNECPFELLGEPARG
ncbi:hypothetical protein P7C70_g7667, partial [Phenoliferia sp. Uapishka_3]